MRRASLWTALGLFITGITFSGCSGGDDGPSNNPSPVPDNTVVIRMVNQGSTWVFLPNPAAAGGLPVRFQNDSSVAHQVVLNDNTFDSGLIAPGATSATRTMPSTGTNYHCPIHPGMGGAVSGAGGSPPPPCEGIYCY
jgi:plastocyanin